LKESIRTDICIVGAGIAGLTTAYLLGREGRSVVVLDDGAVGGGMTGRTTAHLTNAYDDRYVDNVYIATGDSGQGMTHGTIAGMLLTDLIQGRKNRWEDLYSPSRVRVKALPGYASENINVAGQYTEYVTAGDIKLEPELKPGEGAIMREGVSKVAGYGDEGGQVRKLTAVCPHLRCIVAWNSTERTWDCPCHGSRFSAEGCVYQGSANAGLSPAE